MIEAKDKKGERLDLSPFISINMAPQKLGRIQKECRNWCQEHLSDGKFTFRWKTCSWYFEKEEDAVLFPLTWS
jgi:hypothetical protein